MFRPRAGRIPVTCGARLLQMADPQRVQCLLKAPNVRAIWRHNREIVEIQIMDLGYGDRVPGKWGNPQRLSTNLGSEDNPPRVWKLKRLA